MKFKSLEIFWIAICLCLFFAQRIAAKDLSQCPHAFVTQVWAYGDIVTDSAVLDHKQNNIRVFYACKENLLDKKIFFQHRLCGLNDNWSAPTVDFWTFYTDLAPGDYVFQVRCRYEDGTWGLIASHPFRIECPWWQTWWAYLVYSIVLVGILAFIFYLIRLKIKLNNQLKFERQVQQFRTKYVIQASREIRTPLTIIRNIIDKQKGSNTLVLTRSDLKNLRTSNKLLMNMVENLLEFSEVDKVEPCVDNFDAYEMTESPINQQTVLIVEQNNLLADVMRRDLLRYFKVKIVDDGNQLMDRLYEILPAAVVIDTDLVGSDAYALLHQMKQNARFALIPTIIISDFDNNRSLIRAIRSEADDYLQKPFNCEVLTVMIIKKMKKMLPVITEHAVRTEDVDKVKAKFLEVQGDTILEKYSDKLFIEQLDAQIETNMSNPEFDVNLLADLLMISRGQLYKKVKVLKNVTPLEYLRNKRLTMAADLIKRNQYTIQQIMHLVGMPDATNFYQRFKKKYRMSPSVYREM